MWEEKFQGFSIDRLGREFVQASCLYTPCPTTFVSLLKWTSLAIGRTYIKLKRKGRCSGLVLASYLSCSMPSCRSNFSMNDKRGGYELHTLKLITFLQMLALPKKFQHKNLIQVDAFLHKSSIVGSFVPFFSEDGMLQQCWVAEELCKGVHGVGRIFLLDASHGNGMNGGTRYVHRSKGYNSI